MATSPKRPIGVRPSGLLLRLLSFTGKEGSTFFEKKRQKTFDYFGFGPSCQAQTKLAGV
jgi:hypothetical protein